LKLLDLNEDVLRLVLEELSPASLKAVCLLHPRLGSLAQPILFKAIHFRLRYERYFQPPGSLEPNAMETAQLPIIPSLVATIVRRPDLAVCVRQLSCSAVCWYTPEGGEEEAIKVLAREADLQEAVSFVLRQTGLSYRHAWVEALRRGSLDAYLALLVPQLPRLHSLALSNVAFDESDWLGRIARSILHDAGSLGAGMSARFEALEDIHLSNTRCPKEDSKRNTANVLAFLQAPSLTRANVAFDRPPEPVLAWPANHLPSAPRLVSLCVSGIREPQLAQLLAALPGLEQLTWRFGFDVTAADEYNTPVVNLELVLAALARSRHTLTSLTFDVHCADVNDEPALSQFRLQGTMEGLAAFDQLTYLEIPLSFLTGFEFPPPAGQPGIERCLPRNLEKLVLGSGLSIDLDFNWFWPAESRALHEVALWLGEARSWTPRLRKLRLCVVDYNGEMVPHNVRVTRDMVAERAAAEGVEVKFRYSPP